MAMPRGESLTDIRLLTRDGRLISGADVYLQVTEKLWWAWPFYALFSLPAFNRLMHIGYSWFARNRYCVSHACRLETPRDASPKN
jgi:predicted DCC family thiol-disulfide oxidoreductase YuxK